MQPTIPCRHLLYTGCFFLSCLTACTETPSEAVRTYVATIQQQPVKTLPPISGIQLIPAAITYTAKGRRDPFVPRQSTASTTQSMAKPSVINNRQPSLLEKYAVGDLLMVGTISKKQILWGLLESPNGKVHRVMIGDYVGLHQGRIQAIHTDKIIISEQTEQGAKQPSRQTILKMKAIDR